MVYSRLFVFMFIFSTCMPTNALITRNFYCTKFNAIDSSIIIHHNTDIKDSVVCETFGHMDVVYLHKKKQDTTIYKQLTESEQAEQQKYYSTEYGLRRNAQIQQAIVESLQKLSPEQMEMLLAKPSNYGIVASVRVNHGIVRDVKFHISTIFRDVNIPNSLIVDADRRIRDIKFPELEELGIEWIKIMTKVSVKMIKENLAKDNSQGNTDNTPGSGE